MAPKTKKDYVAELEALGETAPEKWTVTELRVRISELKEEMGIPENKGRKTDLQMWVLRLNKASRKKAELQAFNREELQIPQDLNLTIPQLQKQAMEKIYLISRAEASDPVGFGQHSALTYGEIQNHQEKYAEWVIATAQEGQCSNRLRRLATWLEQQKSAPTEKKTMTPVAGKGYAKGKTKGKKTEEKSAPSVASSSDTATMLGVMQQMMNQMAEMKEDIDNIRGRPHKKAAKDEDMESNETWSQVTPPNPAQ